MVQACDYFYFWKVYLYIHPLLQTVTSQQTSGAKFPVSAAQAHALSRGPPPAAAEKQLK